MLAAFFASQAIKISDNTLGDFRAIRYKKKRKVRILLTGKRGPNHGGCGLKNQLVFKNLKTLTSNKQQAKI